MKLIHLSDLHLGKRLNEYSLLEDQKYIISAILKIIDDEAPDGVLIAGDIYDKSIPSAEAVGVFDKFLVSLAQRKLQVFIISGNHDSPERLAFGNSLIDLSGIHISPVFDGNAKSYKLEDNFGKVNIYLLPFIKPLVVKNFFPEDNIESYTDAVGCAIKKMNVNTTERNVILSHQFVTNSIKCDSEEISVGGADNVDSDIYNDFDYVALGHLHGPQKCSKDEIRYCGTPLKYSFSEMNHKKSVTVVELMEKGNLNIRTVPLTPLRDMEEIKGSFSELTDKNYYELKNKENYYRVILTDEEDVPDAFGKLSVIYKNIMELKYDNKRTRMKASVGAAENIKNKSELELFEEFFQKQNNQPMSQKQEEIVKKLIEDIKEAEK